VLRVCDEHPQRDANDIARDDLVGIEYRAGFTVRFLHRLIVAFFIPKRK